jgi:hypothetical protein
MVHPPSTFQLGSGLLELLAAVQLSESASNTSSLRYTWSYTSVAAQAANLPPTVLPVSSAPRLLLDPSVLAPDTAYNFSVLVADTVTGAVVGVSSSVVRVLPAAQQVRADVGVDPCVGHPTFQCSNGGRCVAVESFVGTGVFTLSCVCPTAPVRFFGASCSFALLECPNGNALYSGDIPITLYGVGLETLRRVLVAGRDAPFQLAGAASNSNSGEWSAVLGRWPSFADRLQRVELVAPALITRNTTASVLKPSSVAVHNGDSVSRAMLSTEGVAEEADAVVVNPPAAYQMLTLSSLLLADGSGSGRLLELNFSNVLYYSSSTCRAEGQWKEDGAGGCVQCPPGAFW